MLNEKKSYAEEIDSDVSIEIFSIIRKCLDVFIFSPRIGYLLLCVNTPSYLYHLSFFPVFLLLR